MMQNARDAPAVFRSVARVVAVDRRGIEARPREQPRLRGAVRIHVAVVVEVVAREVGEHRDVEAHLVDAALVERVREDDERRVADRLGRAEDLGIGGGGEAARLDEEAEAEPEKKRTKK